MTEITFYISRSNATAFISKICRKIIKLERKAVIRATENLARESISNMLWSLEDTLFIPNSCDQDLSNRTPIVIGSGSLISHNDTLINLSPDIPPDFSVFRRLLEFVSLDEPRRIEGREKFIWYRSRGYAVNTVTIA